MNEGDPRSSISVTVESFEEELLTIKNSGEVVIQKSRIDVEFNYPLGNEYILKLYPPDRKYFQ